MEEREISNALRDRLADTTGAAPIVWENAPGVWNGTEYATPAPPFWVVSQVKTPPDRFGIAPVHTLSGRLIVAVMAKEGDRDGFATTAEEQAEKIIARFPADLYLTAGDGEVLIAARTYADEGYNDGAYWRVNVHIRWQAVD